MLIALQVLGVVLLVDLVSGLVHWLEDTFWTERTPLVGRWLVQPNVLHHRDAAAFTRRTYRENNGDLLLVGALVVAVAWWLDRLTWHVWLFALLGGHANQFHRWAHLPRRATPALVRWLQSLHVLQGRAHHAGHHGGAMNARYCVITELLNPVLDGIGVWRGLERLLATPRNAPRRADLWSRPELVPVPVARRVPSADRRIR
jgi:ubiquitin-conjugating enzyme E2 variant